MPVKRHGIVHKRLFTLQLRAAYVEKYPTDLNCSLGTFTHNSMSRTKLNAEMLGLRMYCLRIQTVMEVGGN